MKKETMDIMNKNHTKMINNINEMYETLTQNEKTTKIVKKLENMDEMVLYEFSDPILKGFDTFENTEFTLHVLINWLLDDTEIWVDGNYNLTYELTNFTVGAGNLWSVILLKELNIVKYINKVYKFKNKIEDVDCFKSMAETFEDESIELFLPEIQERFKYEPDCDVTDEWEIEIR